MGKDNNGKELGKGISQRKDGRYQGRFTDRFGNRKCVYSKDLNTLRKKLAIEVADNENLTNRKNDITLDEWFDIWFSVYKSGLSEGTKVQYWNNYHKHLKDYFGHKKIHMITKTDIQRFINDYQANGYSYETCNRLKIILVDMFNYAISDQLLINNVAKKVKITGKDDYEARVLTVEEEETFLRYAFGSIYENFYYVALNTGLRPGELFALKLDNDIDFDNKFINVSKTLTYQKYLGDECKEFHIVAPKTKKSNRKVPINSICEKYLKRQYELKKVIESKTNNHNDFLFVTSRNTPINSQIAIDSIKKVISDINKTRYEIDFFNDFSSHSFRHTFATRCLEKGIDAKVVQQWLGHASINMTLDLYTHVTDELSINDIEKLV